MSNWESWDGGVEVGDWIWKEINKTTIAMTTNAWNNEQAKKKCEWMYIHGHNISTQKKTFIIKFPSKLKKSWPTILNIGVPIIEYIDLLDEPKKKERKKEGHHWNLTNYSFDPHFSSPPSLLPFPKVKLKCDHTIKQKNHWNPTLARNKLNV